MTHRSGESFGLIEALTKRDNWRCEISETENLEKKTDKEKYLTKKTINKKENFFRLNEIGAMGTVLSCASVPSSPSNGNAFETETYRIRQLDARYRKKAVMTLRITDTELIIEAKGRRRQPELVASVSIVRVHAVHFQFFTACTLSIRVYK